MPRKNNNDQHQIFVREYLIDFNATRAAIAAGYSKKSARVQGSGLLARPDIQDMLATAMLDRVNRLEITADDILRELWIIAKADPTMFEYDPGEHGAPGNIRVKQGVPPEMTRAVAAVEYDKSKDKFRFRLWSKPETLKTLTQNFQMLLAVSKTQRGGEKIELTLTDGAEYDPKSLDARYGDGGGKEK